IKCLQGEFLCDSILCLPLAFVCNGEYNCRDRTDELNCTTAIINNGLCNLNISINCEQEISHSIRLIEHDYDLEKFLIDKPIQICIQRSSVCDGVVDCKNSIDEQCTNRNPMIQCLKDDEYHCTITNRCIPKTWLCNGINDCKDQYASDELNCEINEKTKCLSNENKCADNSQCVQEIFRCDGLKDCADGSDETPSLCSMQKSALITLIIWSILTLILDRLHFCTPDQFLCKSSQLCIPKSLLCDTVTQCHDNSDELSCVCPIDDYITTKLFYRCGGNICIEKTLKCDGTNEDCILGNDETDCPIYTSKMCVNNTCSAPNQYCKGYFNRKRCVCEGGYRLNYTTGLCEDVNECSEKAICDHYCINLEGSYRCGCAENYQLNMDKHTCSLRKTFNAIEPYIISLGENGLYRTKMNDTELYTIDNESDRQLFTNSSQASIKLVSASNPYLIDYDWSEQTLYYAECTTSIRETIMSCVKTSNIYSVKLNETIQEKRLIINSRDYTSIQSMAVDWLGKNLYFVNTRLQTIDVSIVKGKSQHIVRMSMDGKNLKLFFTTKTISDRMNVDYLRPLLTIDRKSSYLFYYNGHDQIYIINMNGHILSQHYTFREITTMRSFHAFQIFSDKMYQSYYDVKTKHREFCILLKYVLATTLSGNNSKMSERYQFRTSLRPRSFVYQLYVKKYPLYMIDFAIVHPSQQVLVQNNSCSKNNGNCEQLCLLNAMDQTKATCACTQYYDLALDGKSCISNCPTNFFNCLLSKKCIPFYQQCDNIKDCLFGEDEEEKICQEKHCSKQNTTTISCLNDSKCISYTDLCNNVTSCPNEEDENELICGHYCEWPSLATCNKKYGSVCSTDEFLCDGKCVDISHRCDETPYCYDGSDEPFDCKHVTCPNNYFKCPSGKCISLTRVCDKFNDCDNLARDDDINKIGADETNEACNLLLNTSLSFACYDNRTRIPISEYCNGHPDCLDSSDEDHCAIQTVCAVKEYKCDDRCYPSTIKCNGFIDCFDGSDEQNCSQTIINSSAAGCNRPNMFKCKTSAYCINNSYVCDGDLDCSDSSDEENCVKEKSALKDETCKSGYRCVQQQKQQQTGDGTKCILLTQLCDGQVQCPLADDEHKSNCLTCPECDVNSFCIMINRIPECQCKPGFVMLTTNNTCVKEENFCKYGTCSYVNITNNLCFEKTIDDCTCDKGFRRVVLDATAVSCVFSKNSSIKVLLYPTRSFIIQQQSSLLKPVSSSHRVIYAKLVPINSDLYLIISVEERYGRGYIYQQKFETKSKDRRKRDVTHQKIIQLWSSRIYQFVSIEIDWIHRIIYAYYNDLLSLENGIEILYANENYTNLTFIQRLTFSYTKTISAMKVNPLQGYLYISGYFDSQRSSIYRSWLDGSNLEVFIPHVSSPILSMVIDYRHPQLYALLSNGLNHSEIVSYSLNDKQPWKRTIYAFKDVESYSLDMHDDTLIIMKQESQDDYYEVWLDKFNRSNLEKYHRYQFPYKVEYIHEYKYPTNINSNMVKQVCSVDMCKSNGMFCITSPEQRPICITPGEMPVCDYPCHSRGICTRDQCICPNLTYTGDDCKMCRMNNETISCANESLSCVCYLTKSLKYHTPYSCTSFSHGGEIEVPCHRIIQIVDRKQCTKNLFNPPCIEENTISYKTNESRCICTEQLFNTSYCNNNGVYLLENDKPICTCELPFTGERCQYDSCKNKCMHNGTCTTNMTHVICLCPVNYSGERCQTCDLNCKNNGKCVLNTNNITICRCSTEFTGDQCELPVSSRWHLSFIILFSISFILVIIYLLIRFGFKYFQRKLLFSHRRLNEQLGLEVNNPTYTTVPTTENLNRDELSFDELLTNDDTSFPKTNVTPSTNVKRDTRKNHDDIDDPFYVDEKQPIFGGRTTVKMSNKSLNRNVNNDML
ncbi:unnamed protein product, partial [Didymodactylos carnosus]